MTPDVVHRRQDGAQRRATVEPRGGTRVGRLLDRVDAHRTAILGTLMTQPEVARRWRPGPGAWSALDILEHLVLAEHSVLGNLHTVASRTPREPAPLDRSRAWLVWAILRLGIRVRVPARAMEPTGRRSFDELRQRWVAQHQALRAVTGAMDRTERHRHIFHHPVAGPLDTIEALQLLVAHLGTHRRQLDRVAAAWRIHGAPSAQR